MNFCKFQSVKFRFSQKKKADHIAVCLKILLFHIEYPDAVIGACALAEAYDILRSL